jgi:glycosyltransferase involved in cell wall biosynthesis
MHVGLNLVFLVPGETGGMEVAARAVIPELVAAAPGVRFTAFVNREAAGEDFGVEQQVVPVHARNRVEWVRGEQALLPRAAAGVDVLHSLGGTAPGRGRFRRVATIHDLNYLLVPDAHFGVRGLAMRALVPFAAHRSHRVITDSESTRRDLVRHLRVPARRIDVAPLGLGRPAGEATPEDVLRRRYRLAEGRPLLLSLSAKRPHKNLAGLLDALALLPPERRPLTVLPGYATPHEVELRSQAHRLGLEVRFLGWVSDADSEGLLALADAFVFPSFYEGFGLPVLEAMARGVPVACSDRASLPEVAGDAALLFDPDDPAAIAAAIERLLDPAEAARLRAAGPARAATFTWRRTAEALLASYERALSR